MTLIASGEKMKTQTNIFVKTSPHYKHNLGFMVYLIYSTEAPPNYRIYLL